MKIANCCGHTFIESLIGASGVVLDLGVNKGNFSQWISRHTQARLYGYEADPRLFSNLPAVDHAIFQNIAVAEKDGTLPLFLGDSMCSSCVYSEVAGEKGQILVPANSLETIMQHHEIHTVDLIKMDIEGAELAILENLSAKTAARIKQITVEFHEFICSADLPRIKDIAKRLRNLGFYQLKASVHTWGDILYVNQTLVSFTIIDKAHLLIRGKYQPGLARMLCRIAARVMTKLHALRQSSWLR